MGRRIYCLHLRSYLRLCLRAVSQRKRRCFTRPRSLDMKTMNRREILGSATIGLPMMALAGTAERASAASPPRDTRTAGTGGAPAFAGKHQPVPLPFDPTKLTGISERMIVSHHDNNYAGALKNLNKVEEQLAATGKDTAGFLMYEHAYAIDYGAAAPKYVDAFFQNLNWDTVNARLEAAEKAAALFRRW